MRSTLRRPRILLCVAAIALSMLGCTHKSSRGTVGHVDLYGDPLPYDVIARLGTVRFRHPTTDRRVYTVAYSPDGKYIATAGHNRVLRIWDTRTGSEFRTIPSAFYIPSSCFSPDGKRIAVGSNGVTIYDLLTGRELLKIKGGKADGHELKYSPDGKILAATWSSDRIRLFDTATGEKLRDIREVTYSIDFSPDGKVLCAAGAGDKIRFWQVATGRKLFEFDGPKGGTRRVLFSPDGNTIAASGDNGAGIWNLNTREQTMFLEHEYWVGFLAFSPDGTRLATQSGNCFVSVWDLSGTELFRIDKVPRQVIGVSFSPDGRRIASGVGLAVEVWDSKTGKKLTRTDGHQFEICAITFFSDGKRVATADRHELRLWDRTSSKFVLMVQPPLFSITCIALSPHDGKIAAGGGGYHGSSVYVWDTNTGRQLYACVKSIDLVKAIAFSPDGSRFAAAGRGGISIVDAESGRDLHTLRVDNTNLSCLAFSPNSRMLASGPGLWSRPRRSPYRIIRLWEVKTGKLIRRLKEHRARLSAVAFSPDAKLLASADVDGTVLVWDIWPGQVKHRIKGDEPVVGLDFSADGRRLVARTSNVGSISLDMVSGKVTKRSGGGAGRASAVSPDGKTIAIAGDRTDVVILDMRVQ